MVLYQPDLFHTYIGHEQFVNFSNSIKNAYIEVYKMASNAKNTIAIEIIETLGPPLYTKAKNHGQLLRIVKQFENENSTYAPSSWWKIAPSYDNIKDNNDRYNGDDYSFLNLVGDKNIGVTSMVQDIEFEKTGMVFHLPIFINTRFE